MGCGPVGATSLVGDAEVALARAHAADGERLAPYETTLADLYLQKAREEQGYAHYSDAKALAADCVKVADVAAKKAAERRTSGATPLAPAATIQHPALEKAAPQQPAPDAKQPKIIVPAPQPPLPQPTTPKPAAPQQPQPTTPPRGDKS
jgi:hypothetical protein